MAGTFKFTMLALAAIVLAASAMTSGPAAAQQVGTATAVNQSTESTPAGGPTIALTVGRPAHSAHPAYSPPAAGIGAVVVSRQKHAEYRAQSQHCDRQFRLRPGVRQRPYADQADPRNAAIYRRQIKPSGRGHDHHARRSDRYPRLGSARALSISPKAATPHATMSAAGVAIRAAKPTAVRLAPIATETSTPNPKSAARARNQYG